MSALGQKQTCALQLAMSAKGYKRTHWHVLASPRWQITIDLTADANEDSAVPVGLPRSHLILVLGTAIRFPFSM